MWTFLRDAGGNAILTLQVYIMVARHIHISQIYEGLYSSCINYGYPWLGARAWFLNASSELNSGRIARAQQVAAQMVETQIEARARSEEVKQFAEKYVQPYRFT